MGSANDREAYLRDHSPQLARTPDNSHKPYGRSWIEWAVSQGAYLFDVKWDGVRVLAYCEGTASSVTLQNRNGVDVTHRYPDVALALMEVTKDYGRVVFDGEIVVFAEDGKPDFSLVSRRDRVGSEAAARKAMTHYPATFIAFDLLDVNGRSYKGIEQADRLALLGTLFGGTNVPLFTISPTSTEGLAMWDMVQNLGLEGLIVKRRDRDYSGGRYGGWFKVKDLKRVTCIVTGMHGATGSKEGMMGALDLALLDDSTLVEVGKVGTGFTDADREQWQEFFDSTPDYSPHEMGALTVEVEYLNLTNDGRLRMPSYKGTRHDVDASDCTYDQLERA